MNQQAKNPVFEDDRLEGRFGGPLDFLELLQENGVASLLGVDENTLFLAESTYVQQWNDEWGRGPEIEGLDDFDAYVLDDDETAVQICIIYKEGPDQETIYITYDIDKATGRYGVEIVHNDILVYARTAEQDERTEWQINAMANDATDDDGNIIFVGEHTNI